MRHKTRKKRRRKILTLLQSLLIDPSDVQPILQVRQVVVEHPAQLRLVPLPCLHHPILERTILKAKLHVLLPPPTTKKLVCHIG